MVDTETEVEPKIVKPSIVKNVTFEQFIRKTLTPVPSTWMDIKQVAEHFFRVNFWQKTGEGVTLNDKFVKSQFIEVIEDNDGDLSIIEHK